jgi:hypothetical protein
LDGGQSRIWRERRQNVTSEATEMITIPRVEFDAMQAELRRLRREAAREVALTTMRADRGPGAGDEARVFTREQLAEAWGIRA